MIGPNSSPTRAVPRAWSMNSPIRMPIASGSTKRPMPASTVLSPSTADSTEIAGVIMLSPKNRAVANTPSSTSPRVQRRSPCAEREISASSARLPPSPLLSARMMIATYLIVTTIIIDQKIRLSTPNTLKWSGVSG